MTKCLRAGLIALILLIWVIPVQAFDGHRQGFFVGGGVGFGLSSFTQKLSGNDELTSDRSNKPALQTDLKAGSGMRDNLQIFYALKISWLKMKNVFGDNVTVSSGIHSLGATYYLRPDAPSYYLTGGLGVAYWTLPFEDDAPDTWYGIGIYGGAGYEFKRHYSVEINLGYGHPQKTQNNIKASANVISIQAVFGAMAY